MAFLAQVVLQLAGYQSLTLAAILSILTVVLAVMGGWPWIKRWRPFTLIPADAGSLTPVEAGSTEQEADTNAVNESKAESAPQPPRPASPPKGWSREEYPFLRPNELPEIWA